MLFRSRYIHAKIAWCRKYNANSHVISNNPFSYRIGLVFSFMNEEDEQNTKTYCDELAKEYLYGVPAFASIPDKKAA